MNVTISQLAPLAFLGLFQLIGGIAAGSGLRKLLVEHAPASAFLIIWGFGFGGIPTLMGTIFGVSLKLPLLALVGPAVFLFALVSGMLILPWLTGVMGSGTLTTLVAGGAFTLVGSGVALAILRSGKGATWIGLLVAGIFVLVGIGMVWSALSALLRGQTLDTPVATGGTITIRRRF